ncbi:MAG: diphosphate--fructose-6-phosphate 1-phosphotransferase [bacterium]
MERKPRIAILASGGPAPGINSVINAATIEALNVGWDVYGVADGYRGLVENDMRPLSLEDVGWIHFEGGGVLGMSRTNPKKPENLERVVKTLEINQIDMLLTIGGDDTAFGAATIADAMPGKLRTVHVPKTIDNDLPLPEGVPTFGYTTARHVGVGLVKNLMRDAETCNRWYIVTSMGRQAGHLAVGIGKAAGATLTLIPEEFHEPTTIDQLTRIIEGAVIKGRSRGRKWGVAVIAEGLIENLDHKELEQFPNIRRDAFGHILLADLQLGRMLCTAVEERLENRGITTRFNEVTLGYELRCADPVPFDIEYTRDLGFAAIRFLIEGGTNGMVMMVNGKRKSVPFHEMRDQVTGKTKVRNVDISSEVYLVARRYMQRLTSKDFDSRAEIEDLAKAANCTAEEFVSYFGGLVANEPEMYSWNDAIRDVLGQG